MADGGSGGAIIGIAVSGVRKGYIYHNATEFFADADAGAFNIRTLSASNIVLKTNNTLALTVDGTTQKATFAGGVRVTGALYDSSNKRPGTHFDWHWHSLELVWRKCDWIWYSRVYSKVVNDDGTDKFSDARIEQQDRYFRSCA
jgi:hypothetical protein